MADSFFFYKNRYDHSCQDRKDRTSNDREKTAEKPCGNCDAETEQNSREIFYVCFHKIPLFFFICLDRSILYIDWYINKNYNIL